DYDTHNSFASGKNSNDGDAHFWGIGALAKMAYANNWYSEASIRFGHAKNEFDGKDLGTHTDYDAEGDFYSLHVGGGYVWQLNPSDSIDTYAKFFYTHQEGDSTTTDDGHRLKFDDVESQRLRIGGRYTHLIDASRNFYVGLAYEHEFDGEAKAKNEGQKIKSPDLEGGTGIGEIGIQFKPKSNSALTLEVGLHGYVGKREGVTGGIQANWAF
ncbi:MAG: autotransporter outer membrane beta-barrel domain-containing protein, partial [Zoogloeaceae bacterium]|nr:autotransporter outer membrane beta-barrel domain-containing protein [Zoogloeaceae bacterium]